MQNTTEKLQRAARLAASGEFAEFVALCKNMLDTTDDASALLGIGVLLFNYGFLSDAQICYEKAQTLASDDLRATVNLANLLRDAGEHAKTRRLYSKLLEALPDHPVVRRNALVSLEYAPEVPDAERLAQATAWGDWVTVHAGGYKHRPALKSLEDRSLRIGYVSADLCQHTVGLFVKDVLKVIGDRP